MRSVINSSHDPHYNLAMEEYLLKELETPDDYLMLWQNQPAVIVGRNQNTWDEVDPNFIREKNVAVVRRLTGGGAVYHDLGNLNFTFILKNEQGVSYDFNRFLLPVVEVLNGLGLNAETDGRNDIIVQGKKVSGNSQYRYLDRILHHGTLMFNVNLDDLAHSLNVCSEKIASKGVVSVRSRVTNISEHLSQPLTMDEFKHVVTWAILKRFGGSNRSEFNLAADDHRRVVELTEKKYRTWNWNYGASPPYTIRRSRRYEWGKLDIRLDVSRGIILGCKIYGDFFGKGDLSLLEELLENLPYREDDLRRALAGADLSAVINGLDETTLLKLLVP